MNKKGRKRLTKIQISNYKHNFLQRKIRTPRGHLGRKHEHPEVLTFSPHKTMGR